MSDHTQDSNFRYSNDNRDSTPGDFDYPSQQEVKPSAIKGAQSAARSLSLAVTRGSDSWESLSARP